MKKEYTSHGNWELVRHLGRGAFGHIVHWRNRNTGQEIATKNLRVRNVHHNQEKMFERWQQECKFVEELKTEYIVKKIEIKDEEFLSYLKMAQQFDIQLPVLVMEYCDGGNLREHLKSFNNLNGMPEPQIRRVLFCLANALKYLHEQCNIEHRDIKPENIVLKLTKNRESIYKLTDFGYARHFPEETAEQSIVGTAHYMAPEIINGARYTKTVDYWSMGVIAFEMICGIRPFIPHSSIVKIFQGILSKPKNCIAITENIWNPEPNKPTLQYHNSIFVENHCSPVFLNYMEKWLQLTLTTDYKSRGQNANQTELLFYTELDRILNLKILTVFSLKSCEFFTYEITTYENMNEFLQALAKDSKILRNNLQCILPMNHPIQSFKSIQHPYDIFVSKWSEDQGAQSTPIMLYIVDISTDDVTWRDPLVSEIVEECMQISESDEGIPNWVISQFEKHVLYLMMEEKCRLKTFEDGLTSYIREINEMLNDIQCGIIDTQRELMQMLGRNQQLEIIVNEYYSLQGDSKFHLNTLQEIRTQLEAAQWRLDEMSDEYIIVQDGCTQDIDSCPILSSADIDTTDVFKIDYFRDHLITQCCQNLVENSNRILCAQKVFDNFARERRNLIRNTKSRNVLLSLNINHRECLKLWSSLNEVNVELIEVNYKLNRETTEFIQRISIQRTGEETMEQEKLRPTPDPRYTDSISELLKQSNQIISLLKSSMKQNN